MVTRHGTVYLLVLISVLIITVIGLSGLYVAQIQGRIVDEGADVALARSNAEAAIEVGLTMMQEDANWRTTYGDGDWFVDRAMGDALLSLSVRDPDDGDIRDSSLDPVILRGEGSAGAARQMVEVRVEATPGAVEALDSAAHAGRVMAFDGARVGADAVLSSNDSTWASGASVLGAVESAGTIIGATYSGTTTARAPAKAMPIATEVISTYQAMATPIAMDDIATVSSNIAANGHANFSTTNWTAYNCSIAHSTASVYEGEGCISVTGRTGTSSGPLLDVTADIQNGRSYTVSVRVKAAIAGVVRVVLYTFDNDNQMRSFVVDEGAAALTWTEFSGVVTPTWDAGEGLREAVILVRTTLLTQNLDVDALTMVPTTLEPPVIENVALSPTWNPYGAVDAEGVYSIDCAGDDLIIRNCRINGTLLLIDPGPNSLVEGSVAWTVPDLRPSLVVSGDMAVMLDSADLDEGDDEVNYNPMGFGPGDEDRDAGDRYASLIDGLIYVSNDLKVGQATAVDGAIIAGRDITFNGNPVMLTHKPAYAADPPEGFVGASRLVLDRRSWTKVVD